MDDWLASGGAQEFGCGHPLISKRVKASTSILSRKSTPSVTIAVPPANSHVGSFGSTVTKHADEGLSVVQVAPQGLPASPQIGAPSGNLNKEGI